MTTETLKIDSGLHRIQAATQSILFVCTGNVCRSPYMELYFRHLVSAMNIPDLSVSSAGTHHLPDHPIADPMARILQSDGISTDGFRSQALTSAMVEESTLIITAEVAHRASVLRLFPRAHAKVFTLMQSSRLIQFAATTPVPAVNAPPLEKVVEIMAAGRGLAGPTNKMKDSIPDPWKCQDAIYRGTALKMKAPLEKLALELSNRY